MQIVNGEGTELFKLAKMLQRTYKFDEKAECDDAEMSNGENNDWTSIELSCQAVLLAENLTDKSLEVTVTLGNGIEVRGNLVFHYNAEPPLLEKTMAELRFINDSSFNLIQQI